LEISLNEIAAANATKFQLDYRLSLLHLNMLILQNLVYVAVQLYDNSLSQFSGINHLATSVSSVQPSGLTRVLLLTS
jgi:hypothetical protein